MKRSPRYEIDYVGMDAKGTIFKGVLTGLKSKDKKVVARKIAEQQKNKGLFIPFRKIIINSIIKK